MFLLIFYYFLDILFGRMGGRQAAEKLRKSGENSGRMTAGAKAIPFFSASCGTTKVVP
jgi:hypothetical protein